MKIPFFLSSERVVGSGHATLPDTINRALRTVLSLSGFNPDGEFPGFNARRNPIGDGADVTGATDSAAAITLAQTNATSAGLELYPGTYLLNANVTLTKASKLHDGAVLKPNVGVNINVVGPWRAGDWQTFDLSLGGTVTLSTRIVANPMWFGAKADNSQSDTTALTKMIASMQDYASAEFPSGIYRLDSTWTISARRGIVLKSRTSPFPDGANASQFRWNGGAGGTMISAFSCDTLELWGFYFNMGQSSSQYATIGIDLDGTGGTSPGGGGVTGTRNVLMYNLFNTLQSPSTTYSCVRIGATTSGNQEYHRLIGNRVFGSGFMLNANSNITANTTASSTACTLNGTGGSNSMTIGTVYRIRVAGALGGSVLDCNITATGPAAGTLSVAATSTVSGAVTILGQQYGKAVEIICSQSKGIYLQDNHFEGVACAISMSNGSFLSFKNNFVNNEVNMFFGQATESCEDHFSNSEQSRQHAVFDTNYSMPTRFQSCRWGNLCHGPNKGWLELGGSASPIEVLDCEFDSVPTTATGSTAYTFTSNFNGTFRAASNRYASGWTMQQVGYNLANDAQGNTVYPRGNQYRIESVNEVGVIGLPVHWVIGETTIHRGNDQAGTGVFETRTNGATIPQHIGLVGRAYRMHQGNSGDILVGVQGEIGKDNGGGGLVNFTNKMRSVVAKLFVGDTEGFTASEMHGFHVKAPVFSGGGGSAPIRGLYIEDLQGGGGATTPSNTWGVYQVGTSDRNKVLGRTFQAAPASAPTDADLDNNTVSIYLDEAGGNIKIRVRKSDGTYKLATIAMV